MYPYLKSFGKGVLIGVIGSIALSLIFVILWLFRRAPCQDVLESLPYFFPEKLLFFLVASFLAGALFALFEKASVRKLFFCFWGLSTAVPLIFFFTFVLEGGFLDAYSSLLLFLILLLSCGLIFFLFKQVKNKKLFFSILACNILLTLVYYVYLAILFLAMIWTATGGQ